MFRFTSRIFSAIRTTRLLGNEVAYSMRNAQMKHNFSVIGFRIFIDFRKYLKTHLYDTEISIHAAASAVKAHAC